MAVLMTFSVFAFLNFFCIFLFIPFIRIHIVSDTVFFVIFPRFSNYNSKKNLQTENNKTVVKFLENTYRNGTDPIYMPEDDTSSIIK